MLYTSRCIWACLAMSVLFFIGCGEDALSPTTQNQELNVDLFDLSKDDGSDSTSSSGTGSASKMGKATSEKIIDKNWGTMFKKGANGALKRVVGFLNPNNKNKSNNKNNLDDNEEDKDVEDEKDEKEKEEAKEDDGDHSSQASEETDSTVNVLDSVNTKQSSAEDVKTIDYIVKAVFNWFQEMKDKAWGNRDEIDNNDQEKVVDLVTDGIPLNKDEEDENSD